MCKFKIFSVGYFWQNFTFTWHTSQMCMPNLNTRMSVAQSIGQVKCTSTLLKYKTFFRQRAIPRSYLTITEEYRWAAGDWWSMPLLLLSAQVKHNVPFH